MSNDIKLSPKYGLNPTMTVCYWCGEPTNDIAFLGQIDKEDSQAPKYALLNYDFCEKCKKKTKTRITIIGIDKYRFCENQPPITQINGVDYYPYKAFIVVNKKFINKYIEDETLRKNVLEHKKMYLEIGAFFELLRTIENEEKERDNNEKSKTS